MCINNIKAVVFDRDGTLIEHVHYLCDPEKVRLLNGVKNGIKVLKQSGFKLFLHSNQSGVGRGFFNLEQVYACNQRMEELIGLGSNVFSRVCIATEKPDEEILYRKPSPRFANEILTDFDLKTSEICYVGDRYSDLETALNIGAYVIGVNTGLVDLHLELFELGLTSRFKVVNSFSDVVKNLISKESRLQNEFNHI
ncbi:HAD-IIIA family hydrolase [Daejeonella sp. H1SJ63]|uniref:HAD-IIIA family hydrolase n=1 Tax=Daejeonella sp. H1SJ63 TaxID=3034145 RepID=UPI0023EA9DAE|nr:HAD-IIIA family hydrolase [Daejeonella sp. H1SJ63]